MLGKEVMLQFNLITRGLEEKYDYAAIYVVKLKGIHKQVHTLARNTFELEMHQKKGL